MVVSHAWDFGDGTGATDENPTHLFVAPRTYTVTLTVTDDNGATTNCTGTVTVAPWRVRNAFP